MIAKPIYVLNGPNLNLLGEREPHIYGHTTLADIEASCGRTEAARKHGIIFRQSNHEGQLVDWIHEARREADAIVINAGGLTHTSIVIHDALKSFSGPVIELHVTNVHRREAFRHHSYISFAATAVICGLGPEGYGIAVNAAAMLAARMS
ncbi:type II 3-dehydroquinate dehydratase [Sinorhizobium alkalisoli]|uniref:3-dehydroquinate dehydratase n=1 Tax=Sinorhizobium alkalisoli TaxID=1752398 RepID=A0A1E3VFL8_9HYPH|nr:type II 3-dehydroquinate dehydratase [Sinorhizobium alkalisoli]MCA1491767.1 type II 3-dehydroquinate dehydratase [Ensifer sp. NBAIM29]MCG5479239.1 type II 3-dehydroquinate dehydratase [Sinorhizobium alkalisoli]ODR92390.1 type II 3-dehydroquinate dehydratase [Sinorhizobium alkalisoli]QFI66930.1 3-dehydroquinate dehydratase II [Sinorhizobium alkalisoli]